MHKILIILVLIISFGCSSVKQISSKKFTPKFNWQEFTEKQTAHGYVNLIYFSKNQKDSCILCVQKVTGDSNSLNLYTILLNEDSLDFPKERFALGEFSNGAKMRIIHADSCETFNCVKEFKMTWQMAEQFGNELQKSVDSGLSNERAFTMVLKKWKWY